MLFDVTPDQIASLDSGELVELLRRLLYLEARHAGVPLGDVSVPLQITVADGGEDARIKWTGGVARTNFLPGRRCIFQSKATDPGPTGWKKEVWAKSSQKRGRKRVLNPAMHEALSTRAAYVGFTSAALVDVQIKQRIECIREGISDAGGDPDQLLGIKILDANHIAAWAQNYPSVATWLHERSSRITLAGFQTVSRWGEQNRDFKKNGHVDETTARFQVGLDARREGQGAANRLRAGQAQDRLVDMLQSHGTCVRIVGPSGVGKTRFVYETLQAGATVASASGSLSAVYCDFRAVQDTILPVIDSVVQASAEVAFIVDECPRESALMLGAVASRNGSRVTLVTIDTDEAPLPSDVWNHFSVLPDETGLVDELIRKRLPSATPAEVSYIARLSGGFPRIAVLACDAYSSGRPIIESTDDVAEQVILKAGITRPEHLRAIESLSLFTRIDSTDELEFDLAASKLGRMTGDEWYEELVSTIGKHLVDKRGRYLVAQPLPIAAYLGRRRLERLRPVSVITYLRESSPSYRHAFLDQLKHLSGTRSVSILGAALLDRGGLFSTAEELNTEDGSRMIDALVHVDPDRVMEVLNRLLARQSLESLRSFKDGRRYVVWALEKLVFRMQSFAAAARLLLKLGAAEVESYGNSAKNIFKQLFQLHLSGTEVEPAMRFAVLDEAIHRSDPIELDLVMEALAQALDTAHFSRSGEANIIGNRAPLKDWEPKLWSEVFDFHRAALSRLMLLRRTQPYLAERCEEVVANNLRGLLRYKPMFDEVKTICLDIATAKSVWFDGLHGVGDWLYFDRSGAPEDYSKDVRNLYDQLMPRDEIDLALLYTKFWSADIHDPDDTYEKGGSDFEYSTRQAQLVAKRIARNATGVIEAARRLAPLDLKNVYPFARQLALCASDPIPLLKASINAIDEKGDRTPIQFIRGVLAGIQEGHKGLTDEAIALAQQSKYIGAVEIYSAVAITAARLSAVADRLEAKEVSPREAVSLSYGRGLDHLKPSELSSFLHALARTGDEGVWAALEVVTMYQHGRAEFDLEIARFVMDHITNPALIAPSSGTRRDVYSLEAHVERLSRHEYLDDTLARGLAEQVVRLCQVEELDTFMDLDDPFRKIIVRLAERRPTIIWDEISRFVLVASPLERHRLETLIASPKRGFDTQEEAVGLLYTVPHDVQFEWADVDPKVRSPFLCSYWPILSSDDPPRWHADLETLAIRYGAHEPFRRELQSRLGPTSWVGSRVPYLQAYLLPLQSWFDHPIAEVALWARDEYSKLQNEICHEQERDLEDRLH